MNFPHYPLKGTLIIGRGVLSKPGRIPILEHCATMLFINKNYRHFPKKKKKKIVQYQIQKINLCNLF